ncbi:gamma-mobile-trio integrase GmtZ [Acinetobacter silvestris]|uniref:Integrase n=1 Tax=Acinetobacter silvestris TaxID=1977882 RepID=A0A1Y3CEM4_9GAMM|nr:VPA1269 family protein [Acinetobacter silvestris]OTG65537.1 integrase [Acinetobacter silvestris]
MRIKIAKPDGRKSDLTLQWVTKRYGEKMNGWRELAEEWIKSQDSSTAEKLNALAIFLEKYIIHTVPWCADIFIFLAGDQNGWKASSHDFKSAIIKNSKRRDNRNTTEIINYISNFIDWILDNHFFENTDKGSKIYLYKNPLEQLKSKQTLSETVHSPLPYRYIQRLSEILCPKPSGSFSNWSWAQSLSGIRSTAATGWFEVDENLIDKNDEDCVWIREIVMRNKKSVTIYKMWSPVAAMVLFVKLQLPLRTYQVRMLDTGEADAMRYQNGKWIKNTKYKFVLNSHSKGIFRRFKDNVTGLDSTGLYINTNKTADQNKDEFQRGYEIPWQNEFLLYWLEKLRNWQEKYNPIVAPTDCTTLEIKHTKDLKSNAYLSKMGYCCFLMRDATSNCSENRKKPIPDASIPLIWYKLLEKLENNLSNCGDTLPNGTPLQLVHHYEKNYKSPKVKTNYQLHSLRVSLITSYLIEAKLPLPVVSKLLAGHSRILMTIYYTKLTPVVMQEKMAEATKVLENNSKESIRIFLKDAELRQIESKMAFHDDMSIKSILVNRNPIGWELRHHGLCLAGGNNVMTDEVKSIAGCWNGGELIQDSKNFSKRLNSSVGHSSENCVRCRWFITDASYLPALNAHLNFMSYKAYNAANLAAKIEADIESFEELKYEAELKNIPFLKHNELQNLNRRHEKQLVESDEYTKNWIATFNLIRRLVEIEQKRNEDDHHTKLVAVGSQEDIKIGFIETTSELLHLSLLCEDAEIYPDLLDDIKKTSVIQNRTQSLSRIMIRKGYLPHLLLLDQDQQLIAANAMIRAMTKQIECTNKLESFQKTVSYLEFDEFLQNHEVLETGIKTLEEHLNTPINSLSLKSLISSIQHGEDESEL